MSDPISVVREARNKVDSFYAQYGRNYHPTMEDFLKLLRAAEDLDYQITHCSMCGDKAMVGAMFLHQCAKCRSTHNM